MEIFTHLEKIYLNFYTRYWQNWVWEKEKMCKIRNIFSLEVKLLELEWTESFMEQRGYVITEKKMMYLVLLLVNMNSVK